MVWQEKIEPKANISSIIFKHLGDKSLVVKALEAFQIIHQKSIF